MIRVDEFVRSFVPSTKCIKVIRYGVPIYEGDAFHYYSRNPDPRLCLQRVDVGYFGDLEIHCLLQLTWEEVK